MKSLHLLLALIICAALLTAGCTSAVNGSQDKPFWAKETTAPPATPDPTMDSEYVSEVTPYPVATRPVPPTQTPVVTPAAVAYLEVLNEKVALDYGHPASAWAINVVQAPLIVEFSVQPKMVKRTVVYESSYGSHKEEKKTVTSISDKSRLEVTVRDEGGNIAAQDGFAGLYSVDRSKKIFVMSPGEYQVDIRGADVIVDIVVKVGQTGQTPEQV
ncbi:hypothetical protein [uncultured Methanofollis sp.]|uniref:hypothetical protein n=1 Tax=uncultured Methanofollis sp. TaxID=262500 RepID=UPI0026044514|nr:hypothetical protein [uncultured Methanofollis sp.]